MDKNISIVGINSDFISNEFIKSINKVGKNRNIDLNYFGKERIDYVFTSYGLFLQTLLSSNAKILL